MPVEAFRPVDEKDEVGEIRSALERIVLINKEESKLQSVGHILQSLGDVGTMKASHFGDKQHWHAMDSGGKTNGEVRKTIIERMKSLYDEFRKADRNTRFWYVGQMLHCIQDSFSDAHAARDVDDKELPLLFFQDYKAQNGKLHGVADINIDEGDCDAKFDMKGDANLQHLWKTSDIHRIKRVLWEKALQISTDLIKMLDKNAATHFGAGDDQWDSKLKAFFENVVFKFKNAEWEKAKPGGSLPLYAKDASVARRRDQLVVSSRGTFHSADSKFITIVKLSAGAFLNADLFGTAVEPYAIVDVNGQHFKLAVKEMKSNDDEVEWIINRQVRVGATDSIVIKIYDKDIAIPFTSDDFLGEAKFSLGDFGLGNKVRKTLKSPNGDKGFARLEIKQ